MTIFVLLFQDTVPESVRWVVDTSCFTHLFQAGLGQLLEELSPGGIVLIPTDVLTEIADRRALHEGIPDPQSLPWVETAVLTDDEILTHLKVNVALGGEGQRHLGESAVISSAYHRGLIALLDDRAAVAQADALGVPHYSTLWLVVEAYRTVFGRDRQRAAEAVDGLLASGMYLPISDGESLVAWAYEENILP